MDLKYVLVLIYIQYPIRRNADLKNLTKLSLEIEKIYQWKCNFPTTHSVRLSCRFVGWLVRWTFATRESVKISILVSEHDYFLFQYVITYLHFH